MSDEDAQRTWLELCEHVRAQFTYRRLAQMNRELGAATAQRLGQLEDWERAAREGLRRGHLLQSAGILNTPLHEGGPTLAEAQREVTENNQRRLDDAPERRRCTLCLQPIVNGWCRCTV